MVTEGQRVERKGRAKKTEVFAQLVEAAQRLVAVAMACKEQSNQRLRRYISCICRSISAIFSAQANISSSMPAGSFARSAL